MQLLLLPHDIARVVHKVCKFLTGVNVPQDARRVATRRQHPVVVHEPAAADIACMSCQFSRGLDGPVACVQVVDRANVIETTGCYVVARGSICTRHDPRRPQGYGEYFVCCVRIPH